MTEPVKRYYIMESAVVPMLDKQMTYTPLVNYKTDVHVVPLVMAADYARLEQECERLWEETAVLLGDIAEIEVRRDVALAELENCKLSWGLVKSELAASDQALRESRCNEVASTRMLAEAREELAALKVGQEAVAWRMWSGKRWRFCYSDLHGKRGWEPLYLHPAATVPAGCKVVPVERIAIALESVQNAMEDAYNNAYQDCCGRGQGECCGNPIAAWSDADKAIMDALAPAQRELSALLASAEGVKDE